MAQVNMSDMPVGIAHFQINQYKDILVSDEDFYIFQWIFATFLCQGIDLFGVGTNIVSIICFVKQGFKDPVNISLLGLTIADLFSLATLLWSNICLTPAVSVIDLPFHPVETQYLIGGIPHTVFARISGWITALITLERCLCVTMPLKVKGIITPRRASIIVVFVYIIIIAGIIPVYVVNKLEMKWSTARNKTIFGLVFTENRNEVEGISFSINGAFVSFSSFVIIISCTTFLVVKLRRSTKWRMKSATSEQADSGSIRNQKVAKMVVIISLLFITCFTPISISYLAMTLVPGLSIEGKHRNILLIVGILGVNLESINSSVNIFVYYNMSSKYREIFDFLFWELKCKKILKG